MKEVEYNYMSISDKNGEVVAIIAMEIDSDNEKLIVEKALENNLKINKSSKEEYEAFGEEELIVIK